MATYKVIQDIEADDKFLGPLTLKQFIFGAGGAFFAWLSFVSVVKGAFFLLVFLLPITVLGLFLAVPWSKDQPTEVWVLAKIRFYFKPKVRVWNQDGMQELVTITAPKKDEKNLTKGLSKTEVTSRLKILAETLDSRGWSAKRVATGSIINTATRSNSRLIDTNQLLPAQVGNKKDDMDDPMDERSSFTASKFNKLIDNSQSNIRSNAIDKMNQARIGSHNPTHVGQPTTTHSRQVISGSPTTSSFNQAHTLPTPTINTYQNKAQATSPSTPSADILRLSQNDDLDVKTIAREARRSQSDDEEVVISLH